MDITVHLFYEKNNIILHVFNKAKIFKNGAQNNIINSLKRLRLLQCHVYDYDWLCSSVIIIVREARYDNCLQICF